MTERTHVFLVGSPRSGTTWLQLLLAQHPVIATAQETHLFNAFLGPAWDRWCQLRRDPRGVGLQAVMSEASFVAHLARMARGALARIGDAPVLLEKTPAHVRVPELILRLLPGARFVHLVRDPRAVVSSRLAARHSWAGHWIPASAARNARLWASDVASGRGIATLTEHYLEVKYEALLADDHGQLSRVLDWLGLEASPSFCAETAAACRLDRLRQGSAPAPWALGAEPRGFYRTGRADGWRRELTRTQIRTVEAITWPLMADLGYAPVTSGRRPLPLALADLLRPYLHRSYPAVRRWWFDASR